MTICVVLRNKCRLNAILRNEKEAKNKLKTYIACLNSLQMVDKQIIIFVFGGNEHFYKQTLN